MKYILQGRSYEINDLYPPLNKLFPELHAAYLGASPFVWSDLHYPAIEFLQASQIRSRDHNQYFNNFTHVWNHLLATGRYDEAEALWEMALQPALEVELKNPDHQIHKGTAYYYWAITAILRGDIDKGYALMHQAVEEDIATEKQAFPDTPAYALATLNWVKQDQAFRQFVVSQANYLNGFRNTYIARYRRTFSLEDLRVRFLASPPSTELVFLFAYTIARLMRLGTAPTYTVQSRFSAELSLNILFDIVLTIESAIRVKNPAGANFIDHAEFLLQRSDHPLSRDRLRDLNAAFNTNFDNTLMLLITGGFIFSDRSNPIGMQVDVAIAYGIRNRGAHDPSPATTLSARFPAVVQALFNTLFMAIDFLYI
jgi:hypothetical protein